MYVAQRPLRSNGALKIKRRWHATSRSFRLRLREGTIGPDSMRADRLKHHQQHELIRGRLSQVHRKHLPKRHHRALQRTLSGSQAEHGVEAPAPRNQTTHPVRTEEEPRPRPPPPLGRAGAGREPPRSAPSATGPTTSGRPPASPTPTACRALSTCPSPSAAPVCSHPSGRAYPCTLTIIFAQLPPGHPVLLRLHFLVSGARSEPAGSVATLAPRRAHVVRNHVRVGTRGRSITPRSALMRNTARACSPPRGGARETLWNCARACARARARARAQIRARAAAFYAFCDNIDSQIMTAWQVNRCPLPRAPERAHPPEQPVPPRARAPRAGVDGW